MDYSELERDLLAHMGPHRQYVLCKIIDRHCDIEEADICLVIAIGPPTYCSEKGKTIEKQVKKGDYVVVPRKISRTTADITTEYFLVDMFNILGFWLK